MTGTETDVTTWLLLGSSTGIAVVPVAAAVITAASVTADIFMVLVDVQQMI